MAKKDKNKNIKNTPKFGSHFDIGLLSNSGLFYLFLYGIKPELFDITVKKNEPNSIRYGYLKKGVKNMI